jgi:hypothetical protein
MASGNSRGSTIGSADNGTIRIVTMATEFEFVADNLYLGFDPPQHAGNDGSSSTPDLDDLNNAQWWTVISADDGKTDGAPFNTNTNIRIWRNPKGGTLPKMIAKLKDESAPATKAAITVASNALEDQSNLTLSGVRCKAGRVPEKVIVQLYNKKGSTDQKAGDPQAVLNVDVLPKRIIPIGLWHLDDNDPATDDASPAYFTRGQLIIDRLNEVFAQACIEFKAAQEPAQVRPKISQTYGDRLSGPNSSWGPIRYLDPEFQGHNSKLGSNMLSLGTAKLNVVLYRYMRSKSNEAKTLKPPDRTSPLEKQNLGLYIRSADFKALPTFRDRVFVQTAAFSPPLGVTYALGEPEDPYYEDFLLTICHEVGHALGINVWNYKPVTDHRSKNDGHDDGAFPSALYHYDGTPVGWLDSPGLQANERAPLDHRRKERARNPFQLNKVYRSANTALLPRSEKDKEENKRRIEGALMMGGHWVGTGAPGTLNRSLWMRHEDWWEANKNAAAFELQPN